VLERNYDVFLTDQFGTPVIDEQYKMHFSLWDASQTYLEKNLQFISK
jgi:hypothetical protein